MVLHAPSGCSGEVCPPELGASSRSHVGAGALAPGPSSLLSQGVSRELDQKWSDWGVNWLHS